MNDLSEILAPSHVLLDVDAATREDAFRAVATVAEAQGVTDSADALFEGLCQREREVTTGLMDGFAIPHTKTDAANRAAMFFVRSAAPLAWETMDGSPVTNMFFLIAPASDQNNTHLAMLSALASSLLEDDFKEAVAKVATPEELVTLVTEQIKKESE